MRAAVVPHRVANHPACLLQPGNWRKRRLVGDHDAILIVHLLVISGFAHRNRIAVESDRTAVEVEAGPQISRNVIDRDRLAAAQTGHIRKFETDKIETGILHFVDESFRLFGGGKGDCRNMILVRAVFN